MTPNRFCTGFVYSFHGLAGTSAFFFENESMGNDVNVNGLFFLFSLIINDLQIGTGPVIWDLRSKPLRVKYLA